MEGNCVYTESINVVNFRFCAISRHAHWPRGTKVLGEN